MKELTEEEALYKAAAYCSSAEHCRSEVIARLTAWGVDDGAQQRILERLVKERYIDEARYARFYIHDKSRFDKWGRNKIAQGLKLKKVPPAVYAGLLDELDEEEYLDGLRTLLAAKRKHVKARTDYERNGKLIRFALGRGYEMDAIRRCLPEADDDEFMD